MDDRPVVFLLAGESRARREIGERLKPLGLPVTVCRSPEEFLDAWTPANCGCLVLGVSQPPVELEFLERLGSREDHLPVVAVAARGNIRTAVRAMKLGAFDFLEQSISDELLAGAIGEALRWDANHRRRLAQVRTVRRRLDRLDEPHREVLEMVVAGKSNREIAETLELSVRAIEVRRAKVMQTLRARSLAELVRFAIVGDERQRSGGAPGR
jgi:two-component system, LuxR family, response regulator FixJ